MAGMCNGCALHFGAESTEGGYDEILLFRRGHELVARSYAPLEDVYLRGYGSYGLSSDYSQTPRARYFTASLSVTF